MTHGLPRAVQQALSDVSLPPSARLMIWHLAHRLDMVAFRDAKAESLASEMRIRDTTAGQMLTLLVERGYLYESGKRKPRAFRMPWSRCTSKERAA